MDLEMCELTEDVSGRILHWIVRQKSNLFYGTSYRNAMAAVKLRIQDLIEGTFDGKHVHTIFGEVSEARILGTLIDIFTTDDESYMSLTVDDGTETVRIKAWRQDVGKLKKVSKGDFIDIVGKVREYNEEIYLTPEVVSKVSPNKWILRELELLKLYLQSEAAHLPQTEHPTPEAVSGEPEIEAKTEEQEESKPMGEPEEREEELQREEKLEKLEKEKEPEPEKEPKEVFEEELDLEIEEFEILGEDEVVETVLDLLKEGMTKEALIEQSGLDEIDVELALRELLDEKKIKKEGDTYKRADSN
ncbi:MAG: hypothetical protein HXS48_27795 [Theionarchaea archaeon]|nr:hypothetical protein [Theionarchaea archaeon]